jgi:hypothetical protein
MSHRRAPFLESTLLTKLVFARRGGFSGAIVDNRGGSAKRKNSKMIETNGLQRELIALD